jgi:SAM-dependent methyltransferase
MRKLDAIIEAAGIQEGDRVLEIGCGWGGFALRAAATRNAHVTGITLSKEQLAEATARVKAAGLEDRITLLFCDYRDCPGGEGWKHTCLGLGLDFLRGRLLLGYYGRLLLWFLVYVLHVWSTCTAAAQVIAHVQSSPTVLLPLSTRWPGCSTR